MMYISNFRRFFQEKYAEYQAYLVKRSFCVLPAGSLEKISLGRQLSFTEDFEYKDETWEPIHFLANLLGAAANHQELQLQDNRCDLSLKGRIVDNSLTVVSKEILNNWLCFLYKHSLGKNYSFGFDIVIYNEFKEIQVAFRYRSLANRLRFMIRDNREAVFEVIREGRFHKHIFTKPYSLKIGAKYHFQVLVRNNKIGFYINNEEIFLIQQTEECKFLGEGLCLILYNDTALRPVNCEVSNIWIDDAKFREFTIDVDSLHH